MKIRLTPTAVYINSELQVYRSFDYIYSCTICLLFSFLNYLLFKINDRIFESLSNWRIVTQDILLHPRQVQNAIGDCLI